MRFVSAAEAGASLKDDSVDAAMWWWLLDMRGPRAMWWLDRVSRMDLLDFDAGSMSVERELLVVSAHFPVVAAYAMVVVKQFKRVVKNMQTNN